MFFLDTCFHCLINIIAFDFGSEPSYNFFYVSCMLLIFKTWGVVCLLTCFICACFHNESLIISSVVEPQCCVLSPYKFLYDDSTLKAMATMETLSSRHIAATQHLSLTRFVNLLQMRDHIFYFNLCFHFILYPVSWDSCLLWDTVINTLMPISFSWIRNLSFLNQHEFWIESSEISFYHALVATCWHAYVETCLYKQCH